MLFSPRGLQSTLLLVLLGLGHHDVEASEGKQVIHKRVGDSVVLSSNLPAEGVKRATWRYGDSNVAFQGSGPTPTNPFKGRLEFNDTSFSLTIRDLTIEDSGEFSLIAEVNDKQVSVFITLQVHEPISTNSIVFSNVTEAGSDGFCTVFLECKANPHSDVTYSWTVGTQTRNGSTLQYRITPQDGNTTFTCKASNVISEMLESTTLRCSETTGPGSNEVDLMNPFGLFVVSTEVFCSRFEQAAVVDRDPSQLDLNLSPLPGDALVYENSGGAADAQDDENIPPL
ncbi:SLAM family member 5-like isoform X2 [Xiphophorus maculatus]|uniref:SLAM family member 5-like isoform X2 n=1 Tax=Xiphophorus maculatus TaxID=8083 RepID=UPI000C6D3715|nr:SLAM family member 5-like isoform X2 [Xiphophorus maculatus]